MNRELSFIKRSEIALKEPYEIDPTAILGEISRRTQLHFPLEINNNAVIRSGTVIYVCSKIGCSFETGHNVVVRENCTIGDNVKIWNSSTIDYDCKIGSNVKIHTNVYICQETVIEDDVFIGPGVMFLNDKIPVCNKCFEGPIVRKGAKIGAGAIVMPGVTIGENALIGAGAVVVSDVPANKMAYGNPARIIGSAKVHECEI